MIDQLVNGTHGYPLRGGWPEEMGLEVPETAGGWYNVRNGFKAKAANAAGGKTDPLRGNK